jgi:hypothetical protein
MSTLLIELIGNWEFNKTIWPPHVFVYDDLLIYKKRSWFKMREITISYNQIARVTLTRGIFFSHLELETTGTDNIAIRYISKTKGKYAKTIIDQKIYRSHAKHVIFPDKNEGEVPSYEKSVNRLNELLNTGRISQKEFKGRKRELLRSFK